MVKVIIKIKLERAKTDNIVHEVGELLLHNFKFIRMGIPVHTA